MTSYTANRVKHAVTTASTVDVVTLGQAFRGIEVLNRSATDPLYVTVDRGVSTQQITTPTVAGDDCYYVGPNAMRVIADDDSGLNIPASTVRLISSAATAYSITGINPA